MTDGMLQWSYWLFAITAALELYFILGPSLATASTTNLSSLLFTEPASPSGNMFAFMWPTRVAFQHISFIRHLSVLLSTALIQIVPHIFPDSSDVKPERLHGLLTSLGTAVKNLDREGELSYLSAGFVR